jgi:hypothetical protein
MTKSTFILITSIKKFIIHTIWHLELYLKPLQGNGMLLFFFSYEKSEEEEEHRSESSNSSSITY